MDLSPFLKSVEILSDLADPEIALLAENSQYLEFTDGAPIIKLGEIGRFLWIVYDGEVEVTLPCPDGTEKTIAALERGAVLGEMSIMTGEPAMASVVSGWSSKLIRIPREIISRVVATNPKTLAKLTKIITRRLLADERILAEQEKACVALRENTDPYDLNFSSVSAPLKILVVNSGSSSLKYSLFDTARPAPLLEGAVEKIGSGEAAHHVRTPETRKDLPAAGIATVGDALAVMLGVLTDPEIKALGSLNEINAVGHRVVHGGKRFSSSTVISNEVKDAIRSYIPIAPLHNPFNIEGIDALEKLLPTVPQVAVFDTSFHQTMPETAATYAIPFAIGEEEQIRRYGFHGTNHRFVSMSAATFLKRPVGELRIISCHLGSGASVCAIDHGRSIDTSMGMTPLEGLIMGTRAGDLDPGVILHLMRHRGMTLEQVDRMLNKESGLKGISGKSNDMREVLEGAEAEDPHCKLAVSAFCYRLRKYIGSYVAALGGLDVLIFTGGIGENSAEIRARVCQGLETLGIDLADDVNRTTRVGRGQPADISNPASRVRILVVPADEERMIARETVHALGRVVTQETVEKFRSRGIPLSTSAHHVHLSRADFDILFGPGGDLTPRTELSQPGQFAALEMVNLIGPKGRIEKVRILGPLRKETQVEVSRTEQFKLGIDAPIRDSGDLEGTPGIDIEGEKGAIRIEKGVISAKRHIHMSPEEALNLGLRDRDVVMVKVKGVRELIFGDVLIRVHPTYRMDMHLDTDEANAAQITAGTMGFIEAIQHRNFT
ncbi:MAG: acetate/propionate family kinase [Deltaproteobacteria bacterium HGW-Deltaproteobacteria-19]|jgi:acetate kinase|nr:MAG: acetate/propionate family kinase [Deltaproteobacteria bacterium HGW-Deltaproteobacteria-19]